MTLAEDVCGPNGRFLLGEGCELSEKHIHALQSWGVVSVEIVGDCADVVESELEIPEEARVEIEQIIQSRFELCDIENPFIQSLYQETVQFYMHQYQKKG